MRAFHNKRFVTIESLDVFHSNRCTDKKRWKSYVLRVSNVDNADRDQATDKDAANKPPNCRLRYNRRCLCAVVLNFRCWNRSNQDIHTIVDWPDERIRMTFHDLHYLSSRFRVCTSDNTNSKRTHASDLGFGRNLMASACIIARGLIARVLLVLIPSTIAVLHINSGKNVNNVKSKWI